MRVLKLAILSFIFLFLLVTVISFFIPANISISKATNIASADSSVYENIRDLRWWKRWHPAFNDIAEDEISAFADSIRVRNTLVKVIKRHDDGLMTEIITPGNRAVSNDFRIIHYSTGDSATLHWHMQFPLRWYPWEKFKSLFYENFYGTQMEQGLSNLKELRNSAVRQ